MTETVAQVLEDYHRQIAAQRTREQPVSEEQRFMAVGPETGQFLAVLVRALETPHVVELGTSLGYSTLWLAEAAARAGGHVTTFELSPVKSATARASLKRADLAKHVDFRVGDAVKMIAALDPPVDFVLLDLWKDLYVPCLHAIRPKLAAGATIVADNMENGGEGVAAYEREIRASGAFDSVRLPVGSGLLLSRLRA